MLKASSITMSFRYIDSHVHFWDPARLNYAWLAEVPSIQTTHTPQRLDSELGAARPERLVFVQADCDAAQSLDEVAWIEQLAEREARIGGIVAHARMDAGAETLAHLDRLAQRPLVRGVRHLIQGEKESGFCVRPEFVTGVQALASRGLSFDLCCRSHQLPDVAELVRRCPEVSFVLDHAGKPPIAGGDLRAWEHDIGTVAASPNVVCKVSGLVTEADHATWTPPQLRPVVERVRECFGPSRMLFGSDWPVVKLAGGYVRWLDVARELLSALPAPDLDAVFHGNARRVYRLS